MTLCELPNGHDASIERIETEPAYLPLLQAMGVCAGNRVVVLRRAPLGGPLHVRIGETSFALDRSLAAAVVVNSHHRKQP